MVLVENLPLVARADRRYGGEIIYCPPFLDSGSGSLAQMIDARIPIPWRS